MGYCGFNVVAISQSNRLKGIAMNAFILVYQGTDQPVHIGDIFYIKGEAHTYVGDWDILDTMPGGTVVVETDKAIVDAYKLGVELLYAGARLDKLNVRHG